MSLYPDGEPRIPNQTPIPHLPSVMNVTGASDASLPQGPQLSGGRARAQAMTRLLTRMALVTAVILGVAVVIGFVLMPDSEDGIWIVAAGAVLSSVLMTTALLRRQRTDRAEIAAERAAAGLPPTGAHAGPSAAGSAGPTSAVSDAVVHDAGYPVTDFAMTIEDVFSITGRGTVVTGQVSHGHLQVGQEVTVLRHGQAVTRSRVTGIEMFRRTTTTASPGDNVGLLLAAVRREDLVRGDVVTL
ncbi:hypothetical protein C8046_09015 [Serinibacter arcticus]|uniref:Translation elongation factor EFTu-like domain-containing protein n=1 Tax=Serinibacter arcticus TaxID=1655435 RepID=A0A2U1ZUV9_9MICO|nr:EF-Tu/IF-2/RF-3 family GTPase [Serinibacter arcticus]PWD50764.1 hypothetical protein C8046_09015 [Serinibacter arcticus]